MADRNIAALRSVDKPTFIYGLIDPVTHQLRYIGKTVLTPGRRLSVHAWRSRSQPHKRHSMAWILSLERRGFTPEVVTIEEIAIGGDWVEAEQFWIAYFRMIGADLCNHTIGGEGQTGYKQSPELIEKRISKVRGLRNPNFGKPMLPQVKAALALGGERMRADPERHKWAIGRRRAGITEETRLAMGAGAKRNWADPSCRSKLTAKISEKGRTAEARQRTATHSTQLWATMRDTIIAAQNAGKDEAWRAGQSVAKKRQWAIPGNKMVAAMAARRKLSDDDIAEIRKQATNGESQREVAQRFGVSPSMVSMIRSGKRR